MCVVVCATEKKQWATKECGATAGGRFLLSRTCSDTHTPCTATYTPSPSPPFFRQVIIGRVPEGFGFSYQGEEPLKFMSSQAKGCKFDQFESKHKFADGFPEGQFNMLCVPKAAADAARHGHEASVAAAMDATVPEKQN